MVRAAPTGHARDARGLECVVRTNGRRTPGMRIVSSPAGGSERRAVPLLEPRIEVEPGPGRRRCHRPSRGPALRIETPFPVPSPCRGAGSMALATDLPLAAGGVGEKHPARSERHHAPEGGGEKGAPAGAPLRNDGSLSCGTCRTHRGSGRSTRSESHFSEGGVPWAEPAGEKQPNIRQRMGLHG